MTTIHPHWETTDVPRARRSAPALMGIAAILIIGFLVFEGKEALRGQSAVTADAHEVLLTDDAVDPAEITVMAGETIAWRNAGNIPHVLVSETLMDENGAAFESTAIFPGTTYEFTIPAQTQPGEYEYMSQTSLTVAGSIIVEGGMAAAYPMEPATEELQEPATQEQTMGMQESAAVQPASETQLPAGSIPQNPHTIANDATPATRMQADSQVLHSGAPATAETGPALWVTIALVLIALIAVIRMAATY